MLIRIVSKWFKENVRQPKPVIQTKGCCSKGLYIKFYTKKSSFSIDVFTYGKGHFELFTKRYEACKPTGFLFFCELKPYSFNFPPVKEDKKYKVMLFGKWFKFGKRR